MPKDTDIIRPGDLGTYEGRTFEDAFMNVRLVSGATVAEASLAEIDASYRFMGRIWVAKRDKASREANMSSREIGPNRFEVLLDGKPVGMVECVSIPDRVSKRWRAYDKDGDRIGSLHLNRKQAGEAVKRVALFNT